MAEDSSAGWEGFLRAGLGVDKVASRMLSSWLSSILFLGLLCEAGDGDVCLGFGRGLSSRKSGSAAVEDDSARSRAVVWKIEVVHRSGLAVSSSICREAVVDRHKGEMEGVRKESNGDTRDLHRGSLTRRSSMTEKQSKHHTEQ